MRYPNSEGPDCPEGNPGFKTHYMEPLELLLSDQHRVRKSVGGVHSPELRSPDPRQALILWPPTSEPLLRSYAPETPPSRNCSLAPADRCRLPPPERGGRACLSEAQLRHFAQSKHVPRQAGKQSESTAPARLTGHRLCHHAPLCVGRKLQDRQCSRRGTLQ